MPKSLGDLGESFRLDSEKKERKKEEERLLLGRKREKERKEKKMKRDRKKMEKKEEGRIARLSPSCCYHCHAGTSSFSSSLDSSPPSLDSSPSSSSSCSLSVDFSFPVLKSQKMKRLAN